MKKCLASIVRCCESNDNYSFLHTCHRITHVVFRCIMKVLGPLLVTFAVVLIFSIIYIFFMFISPVLIPDIGLQFCFHTAIALLLSINICFNYAACIMTAPGSPPRCLDPGKVFGTQVRCIGGERIQRTRLRLDLAPGVSYRYCKTCKCIKPPRAHHDSVTSKCIYEMDHYCPWMNNVVGYYNYRYFVLFLVYMFAGCVYCLLVSNKYVLHITPSHKARLVYPGVTLHAVIIYFFTIVLSGALAVGILLIWHIYLMLTNQTTIEFYINHEERQYARGLGVIYRNPYDVGWRKNLQRVFGAEPWYYHLIPSIFHPQKPQHPLVLDQNSVRDVTLNV